MTEVTDSPQGWVNEHIQRYVASGGADGHEWKPGVPTLLLTTTGNKSGLRAPYRADLRPRRRLVPGRRLRTAARPGTRPGIATSTPTRTCTSRSARGVRRDRAHRDRDERDRLWPLVTAVWPAYDDYQARTDRQIPVVVLTPAR